MRHNRDEKRFDRTYSHLKSMLSNMTNDLVVWGRIRTTTPKAKVLRKFAERMITLGKDGSLSARRRAMAFMRNKETVTKLFAEVAPRFKERNGGYTRILKIGQRPGDNASMSIIELVEGPQAAEAKPKAAPKKKAPAKAKPAGKQAAAKGEKPAAKPVKAAARKEAKKETEAAPRKRARKASEKA
ncbi:MAG: 50S ribosomal protein L17 [Deltaproteobacteria bacterium]|nr:50S ribosomal protein L17 [Deltaproteobacteria bacterium]